MFAGKLSMGVIFHWQILGLRKIRVFICGMEKKVEGIMSKKWMGLISLNDQNSCCGRS
jgi:hypothetical protein